MTGTKAPGSFSLVPRYTQATVLCDVIVLYCMKKRYYYREKKYKYVEDYEQVGHLRNRAGREVQVQRLALVRCRQPRPLSSFAPFLDHLW